jgi:DNA helicase IV
VITTDPGPCPISTASRCTPPGSAKGLEFDVVAVVDPAAIGAACPADLYVAMTRATRRLILVG